MSGPRVVIAAGGTAGHVVPAIAVADALRAEGADVRFAGGERAEAELVPAAGYAIDPLNVEGISRTNPLKAARAAAQGRRGARRGGAAAAPPPGRRRARRRRLRGRARRPRRGPARDAARARRGRLAPRPDQPPARRRAPAASAWPSRSRAATATATCSPAARCRRRSPTARARAPSFGLEPGELTVLVFGGSLGARSINEAAIEAFADAPYRVLHVAGRRDFAALHAPGPHYVLRDYVVPFGTALAAADLAVARAGRLGVRARPVRPAVDADPVSARVRQPPGGQRPLDGAGRSGHGARRTPSSRPSGCAPRSTRSSRTSRAGRRWPPPRPRWPGPTPRRRSRTRCWRPCSTSEREPAAQDSTPIVRYPLYAAERRARVLDGRDPRRVADHRHPRGDRAAVVPQPAR